MSSEATTEIGGALKTAWTYRTIYLSEKIFFKNFYCPYCEIPLHSRNINVDGEIVKSPHFYVGSTPHIGDCNGEANDTQSQTNKPVAKNTTLSRDMKFPEELVMRPLQKEHQSTTSNLVKPIPITLEEIRQRRVRSGKSSRPKATSYLLQAFVEAKNIIIKKAYDAFTEETKREARSKAIDEALLAMPLKLDDDTNYKYAFRTMAYPHNKRRIYYGTAKVSFVENTFILRGKSPKKSTDTVIDFSVSIPLNLLEDRSPKYHHVMLGALSECLDTGCDVKFNCFGQAVQAGESENAIELSITNLDYLYLIKPYLKK